jgi:guanylate kinase
MIFIISGPAGAGKKVIIDGLKDFFVTERIITTSTREMRPNESEGDPYYFVSKKKFKEMIKKGDFIEWALEMNDNYYGGTKKEVERVGRGNKVGVWEIEYKGVIAAKKLFPELKAILINAPLADLEFRLRDRDKDRATSKYIKERMDYNKEWLRHKDIYDYEVMNYDGQQKKAIADVVKIIKKELKKKKICNHE